MYRSPQLHRDHVIDPGLESTPSPAVAGRWWPCTEAGVPPRRLHVGADELALPGRTRPPAIAMGAWAGSDRGAVGSLLWPRRGHPAPAPPHARGREGTGRTGHPAARPLHADPQPGLRRPWLDLFVWNNVEGAEDLANRLANAGYRIGAGAGHVAVISTWPPTATRTSTANWANYVDLDTVSDFRRST